MYPERSDSLLGRVTTTCRSAPQLFGKVGLPNPKERIKNSSPLESFQKCRFCPVWCITLCNQVHNTSIATNSWIRVGEIHCHWQIHWGRPVLANPANRNHQIMRHMKSKNPSRRAAKGPSKQPPAANFPRILQPQGHKNLDGRCWLWRTHLQLAKQMVYTSHTT